jgi:hypothetical protein
MRNASRVSLSVTYYRAIQKAYFRTRRKTKRDGSQAMSVCLKSFHLKQTDHGKMVRCDQNQLVFYSIKRDHPLLAAPRKCAAFDEDLYEEVMSDCLKRGPGKLQ